MRRFSRMTAVFLILLLLMLSGCQAQQPPALSAPAEEIPAASEMSTEPFFAPMDDLPVDPAAEIDLDTLRSAIAARDMRFGYILLGYLSDPAPEDLTPWLWENAETTLKQYPFLRQIPAERIINREGFLICLVPRGENDTLAINRVDFTTPDRTNAQVLYRSESGEPVLLFLPEAAPDLEVLITNDQGDTCPWYPMVGESGCLVPCVAGDRYLSWDFTDYPFPELSLWLLDGWLGPSALGLSGSSDQGECWFTFSPQGDISYSLLFRREEESAGSVDLDWQYVDQDEPEAQWSGWWSLATYPDQPSMITLSLSLVGGRSRETTDGPFYLSDTYPALFSANAERLVLAEGLHGVLLPFMSEDAPLTWLGLPVG